MSALRVGVLGCADIAVRRMLPAFASTPGAVVAAVASRDPAKARDTARDFGCRAVTGYAGLIAREDVDAVYVPLPAALHERWVEAALRAGKHVLAEKPVTPEAGRTEALLDLARANGRVLMENVMFVHHRQHAAVLDRLREGAIGELRSMEATFTIPARPAGDIRLRADLGGGALGDVGVYPVRAALHLLGAGLRVRGAVLTTGAGHEVETAGAVLLRRDDGVTATLTFGMDHAYRSAYALTGSSGRITVDRAFTPPAGMRPEVRIWRDGGVEALPLDADDQVARTVEAFVAATSEVASAAPEAAPTAREVASATPEGAPGVASAASGAVRDLGAATLAQARLLDDIRRAAR